MTDLTTHISNYTTDTTPQWGDRDRSTFIGGSDVGAIMGWSPWKTPLGVYREKMGMVPPLESNEAMEWGRRLEWPVLQRWVDDHLDLFGQPGVKLEASPPSVAIGGFDWKVASPDAVVRDQDDGTAIRLVEVKTARSSTGWGGRHPVPLHYVAQVQWYMSAFPEVVACDVAVLIGGSDYRCYEVERDDDQIARIHDAVDAFWYDHVEAGVPPPFTGGDDAIRSTTADPDGATVLINEAIRRAAIAYNRAAVEARVAANRKQEAADELKAFLGDRVAAVDEAHADVVSWRPIRRTRFDLDAFRQQYPTLAANYTRDDEYRRLVVRSNIDNEE